jgi:anti-sigma regulatory factor (Ser/Thr protein kinase)
MTAAAITLPGVPASVREARRFARRQLAPGKAADTAALAVSELATNAIEHTASGLPGGTFTMAVTAVPRGMAIFVVDQGLRPAAAAPARAWDEHGRGLAVVAAVAEAWGAEASPQGRVTWCVIARGAAEPAPTRGCARPRGLARADAREGGVLA